ncbi:MAG: hypothetical protein AABZ77_00740 [Chloroflexota bacterium]
MLVFCGVHTRQIELHAVSGGDDLDPGPLGPPIGDVPGLRPRQTLIPKWVRIAALGFRALIIRSASGTERWLAGVRGFSLGRWWKIRESEGT